MQAKWMKPVLSSICHIRSKTKLYKISDTRPQLVFSYLSHSYRKNWMPPVVYMQSCNTILDLYFSGWVGSFTNQIYLHSKPMNPEVQSKLIVKTTFCNSNKNAMLTNMRKTQCLQTWGILNLDKIICWLFMNVIGPLDHSCAHHTSEKTWETLAMGVEKLPTPSLQTDPDMRILICISHGISQHLKNFALFKWQFTFV